MTPDIWPHPIWRRARIVPPWFKDTLHALIYAGCDDAYLAVQAFAAMLEGTIEDETALMLLASGRTREGIGDFLGVSRHCVSRRLRRMRERLGGEALSELSRQPVVAALLGDFYARGGADDGNVRTVIDRLKGLSRNELGVLFCILRRQGKDATLAELKIGHTTYHKLKRRLARSFPFPSAQGRELAVLRLFARSGYGIIRHVCGKVHLPVRLIRQGKTTHGKTRNR